MCFSIPLATPCHHLIHSRGTLTASGYSCLNLHLARHMRLTHSCNPQPSATERGFRDGGCCECQASFISDLYPQCAPSNLNMQGSEFSSSTHMPCTPVWKEACIWVGRCSSSTAICGNTSRHSESQSPLSPQGQALIE